MDQDRWKTVNYIFHAALERSSGERQAFVCSASNGDPEIQAEVEVLLRADQEAGSYLGSPLLAGDLFSNSDPSLNPGDVLCGRFRILRHVGEGGMGHVFEAFDSELAVHVALKVIRSEIASNPEALTRFRQEVRLARRITHPNVCRTFDIERETRVVDPKNNAKQEVIFLTMEFLEGETLDSRIKRIGSLPLDEALHVARQIADALTAAHVIDIVHRDMKPANVMLVPGDSSGSHAFRAVITDFGLARVDTTLLQGSHSPLSHSGHPIGTLAYMAPEQLEGVAVSEATDIYAFGLILFEIATGTRAFPSDNFLSGIAKRLNGPPPFPSALVPNLPASWSRAIEGCLRLRPSDRLESATKVIEVLDGRTGSLPALLNPRLAQWVTLASWPPHRRFIGLAGILIVFVALYVGGYRLYKTSTDSKVNPGALVYLTQIRNLTGERSFDNLTELLKAGLGQSAQINLLDQSRVGDTLQLMTKGPNTVIDEPLAREIAMRTGALRVVFATVTGSAGTYQIHIDIQKPDTVPDRYRERWEENFPYKISASLGSSSTIPPELLTAVRNASDWIRFETGESRNDIALLNTPPEDVTTSSWKALAAYSRAESLSSKHEKDDALSALQAAVAEDPQFALAYARMGDVDVSLGRSEDGYRAYARALDTSFDRRLTRRELDRIRGIYASDTWDYSAAESAFRDYALFFPNDFRGWFYRALPLMHLGRYEEAIATLKNAERVDPGGIYAPYDLALCFIELGDVGSSKRWIGVLRERHDIEAADELDGILAFLAGDSESAERYFELVRKSPIGGFRLEGFALLDRIHAERGDLEGSLAASTSGASEAASQGNPAQQARFLLDQASAECGLRKFRGCLTSIHQATSLDSSPELLLSAGDIAAQAMTSISVADARPFHDLLRTLSTSIPQEKLNTAYTLVSMRLHAELFASSGRIDEGLQEAHRAAAIDTQYRRRDQLARLLLRAAVQTDSPSKRTALHSEAYENLALSALHPTTIWLQPTLYPPGAWADDLHSLVETLPLASHSDSKLQTAESLFNAIRSTHITSRKGT